jgi:hypothetical protein
MDGFVVVLVNVTNGVAPFLNPIVIFIELINLEAVGVSN